MNTSPNAKEIEAGRRGVIAALAAYIFWGLAPIYFKFIQTVPPLEIITHRILWSIPLMAGFLLLRDGRAFWQRMRLPLKSVMTLLLSSVLLACNWLIFVWAVAHDQILSTSLGYFTGPLINFLLGYLFLRERLTRIQLIGVIIAGTGTVYLAWYLGTLPWIVLGLATSFGMYGLIRKKLDVGPMVGLLWEALLLVVPALLYMAWRWQAEILVFGNDSLQIDVLLALSGLVTILPLIWFNVAARTLRLTALGFFQYLAPMISFAVAVFLYKEPFTSGHAVAFSCIWLALALVSVENLSRRRRMARAQK